MDSRFPRPETVTLTISGGDTLTVKKRLTAGEQRKSFERTYVAGIDGALKVNPLQIGLATITAFLVDWSLCGDDGARVVIRGEPLEVVEAALDALDPESFAEIKHAIEVHERAMLEARAQEKKLRGGGNGSAPISASPSGSDGGSTGSGS